MTVKAEDEALIALVTANPGDAAPILRLPFFVELFPIRAKAAQWVFDYFQKHKALPKVSLLKREHQAVDTLIKPPPLSFCYDALRKDLTNNIAYAKGTEMTELLESDVSGFIKKAQELVDGVSTVNQPVDAHASDSAEHLNDLIHKVTNNTALLKTMPSGFKPLDDEDGGGLRPGHIYVLASLVNLGKTYVSMAIAEAVRKAGFRVLYYSLEMTKEDLVSRSLAIRYNLDTDQLIKRQQPKGDKDTPDNWYKKLLLSVQATANADNCHGRVFVKGSDEGELLTPRIIRADCAQYKPDLIVIDAAQDLRDDQGSRDRTPALYNAIAAINNIAATHNAAVILTVQMDPEVERKGLSKGNLTRVAWGQVFAQKATILFTMLGDRASDTREIKVEKNRNGTVGRVFWLKMTFPCVKIEATTKVPGSLDEIEAGIESAESLADLEAALAARSAELHSDPLAETPIAPIKLAEPSVPRGPARQVPHRLIKQPETPLHDLSPYARRRAEKAAKQPKSLRKPPCRP
jgi:replicative DNA helicase